MGSYRATVTKLFKKGGKLHVTVGYIPTQSADDSILNASSDTPTKYMDYLFTRQSGSWYLTGLTDSETKPESSAESSPASASAQMEEHEVQDAILASTADSASAAADSASAADEPAAQSVEADAASGNEAASGEAGADSAEADAGSTSAAA